MREMGFRAWSLVHKEWIEKDCLLDFSGRLCTKHSLKDYDQEKVILMQYTGLKDKNGKEIYEGDILAYSQLGLKADMNGDVRFCEGAFIIWMSEKLKHSVYTSKLFIEIGNCIVYEIIGNIYENPELLDKK